MEIEAAKTAIREELARRVTFSGGPEVFRRFLRATADVADAALRELVAEGFLKETELRVGRIYSFPANTKSSHAYLAEQLARMKTEGAQPQRPARAAHAPVPRAAPPPAAVAAPSEVSPVGPAPPPPPLATGPVKAKKQSQMTPEELAALLAERAARTNAPPPTAPPPAASGPVKPKKRSEMTPEELAADEAVRAARLAARAAGSAGLPTGEPTVAPVSRPANADQQIGATFESPRAIEAPAGTDTAPPAPTTAGAPPPGAYTGPVKPKKRSEMTPEELEAAEAAIAARLAARTAAAEAPAPMASEPTAAAPAAGSETAPPAPPPAGYTGPVKAKKRDEMTPEELEAAFAARDARLAERAAKASAPPSISSDSEQSG